MKFELFSINTDFKLKDFDFCLLGFGNGNSFFCSLLLFTLNIYDNQTDFDWDFLGINGIIKYFRFKNM